MARIWVVGSLNVDLVVHVERFPNPGETLHGSRFDTFLGGKGGNQAMALCRLGGAPTVVARVGDDEFGKRYITELANEGGDTRHIAALEGVSTGTALIEVAQSGQNRIVVVPGANGVLDEGSAIEALAELERDDYLLVQLETPLETVWKVIEFAHSRGAQVILDPAPAVEIPDRVFTGVSWTTPNEHEAHILTGVDTSTEQGLHRACQALLEAGVSHALVKAGGRGAVLATRDNPQPVLIPGYRVEVVDTTAAGDSFNGGLAWALSQGYANEQSVKVAHAVAALSVTGMGAQAAMPTADRVKEFMHSQRD